MSPFRRFLNLLEHEPLPEQLEHFRRLSEADLSAARSRHLQRRRWPAEPTGVGVLFVLSAFGVPGCLVLGLLQRDVGLMVSSVFWLATGAIAYLYLATAAGYWREHTAIRREDTRRYGRPHFG